MTCTRRLVVNRTIKHTAVVLDVGLTAPAKVVTFLSSDSVRSYSDTDPSTVCVVTFSSLATWRIFSNVVWLMLG